MSGGSFNYLFSRSASDLVDNFDLGEMTAMAEELKSFGKEGELASEATLFLLSGIKEVREAIESLEGRLAAVREVWRAVEHTVSQDSSRESVAASLKAFNAKQ